MISVENEKILTQKYRLSSMNPLQILIIIILGFFILKSINNKPAPPQKTIDPNIAVDWKDTEYGFGYGEATPSKKLRSLIKDYGPPSMIDTTQDGSAIWDASSLEDTPFERIEIRDVQVPHNIPKPHVDFLYSWYRINIPPHLVKNLHLISKNITYDPVKKLMSARCNDMRSNIVMHWIVKHYATYQLSIDEAGNMIGPMTAEILQEPTGMKTLELLNEL